MYILEYFKSSMNNISQMENEQISKNLDLTIKMWDRNPAKDIFQGNYSSCCIGMGSRNGSIMPHYILNTAYNMIEIVDNNTGKTIGNALCYFVVTYDQKPILVIDNIEIHNTINATDEMRKQIRDKITQYSSAIAEDVTGNKSTPICMGIGYNDVPISDLPIKENTCMFVGKLDCKQAYMDVFGGWHTGYDLYNRITLLPLANSF